MPREPDRVDTGGSLVGSQLWFAAVKVSDVLRRARTLGPARHAWSRRGWLAFGTFVVVVLAAAVIGFLKAPDLYPLTIDPGADAGARATREAARSAAITTTRASILAALAGVGALVTIAINYRNSSIANETFRISEQTFRISERGLSTGQQRRGCTKPRHQGTNGSSSSRH